MVSTHTRQLASITGPFGTATFTSEKRREDLQGATALEQITYQDQVVDFGTVFRGSSTGPRHLFLHEVTLRAGAAPPKRYLFTYDPTPLPPRNSYNIDHYGYFNGADNTTWLPAYSPYFDDFPYANREVNPRYAQAGILKQITYPTGGYTVFSWDSNHYIYFDPYSEVHRDYTNIGISKEDVPQGATHAVTFSINEDQDVAITYSIGGIEGGGTSGEVIEHGDLDLRILNASGTVFYGENVTKTGTDVVALPAGTYTLETENKGIPLNKFRVGLRYYRVRIEEVNDPITQYLGGLRIKAITSYAADGALFQEKSYTYGDLSVSNEVLDRDYYGQSYHAVLGSGTGGVPVVVDECVKLTRSSSPQRARSHAVSYTTITEYNGTPDHHTGRISRTYYDLPDEGGGTLGTPKNDRSWIRNLVKETRFIDETGFLERVITNNYELIVRGTLSGLKAGYLRDYPEDQFPPVNDELDWRTYAFQSEWARLNDRTVSHRFLVEGQVRTADVTTTYDYFHPERHLSPNRRSTTDSKGVRTTRIVLYPEHYTDSSSLWTSLRETYFNKPVETLTYLESPDRVVKGEVNHYGENGTLLRKGIINEPHAIEWSSFLFSNGSPDPAVRGPFTEQPTHTHEVTLAYDAFRLKHVLTRHGVHESFLWSYDGKYA
ncbi:MAG: hypothetical protein AAF622_18025, partial [Cyanobacteria bacterium P01_C01_bin.147]